MNTWKTFFTRNKAAGLILLVTMMGAAAAASLIFGSSPLDIGKAVADVAGGELSSPAARILVYVRIPRMLACILAGSALAVSGVIIQGVMNNALAGPNVIGINAGAGFFCVLAALIAPGQSQMIPAFSFFGAMATTLVIYFIGVKTGASRVTIVLAGVAVSGILSAFIDAIVILNPDIAVGTGTFFVGGFSGITLAKLFPAAFYIGAGLILSLFAGRNLNVLALGEETAKSLGMRIGLTRFFLIILSSLLAGAAVSFAGLLGFVGLMIPHAVRAFTGVDHNWVIPYSAVLGATFVMVCDTLSRVIFAPFEIPVGIILSVLGGVFFIFLLLRQKRRMV